MDTTPRREIVAVLLDRAAELTKEDAPAAYLAARLLAGQFARDDRLYDDQFCLSGDHALNAVIDQAALTVAEYVFATCGYENIAAQVTPTREAAFATAQALTKAS